MIIELLIDLLVGVVELVASLLGSAAAPGWLTATASQMTDLVAIGASMGAWVPWGTFGAAVGAIMTCVLVSLTVRIVRVAISLFTGGGGSAA